MLETLRHVSPIILTVLIGQALSAADAPEPVPSKAGFDAGRVSSRVSIGIDKKKLMTGKVPDGTPDPDFGPPTGAILDLNGTARTADVFQQFNVNFTATLTTTAITFALRSDPGAIFLEQASVVDLAGGGNLLTNGNFSGGIYTNNGNSDVPVGWTYANPNGAVDIGGAELTGCIGPTSSCWEDPSVFAYDTISQNITTIPGHTYHISFSAAHTSSGTYCITTAACGTAVDLLVYAQGASGTSVPATPTAGLWFMALLLLAAGLVQLRRGLMVQ